MQLLGKSIPYVDAARSKMFEEEKEIERLYCNVIMIEHGMERGKTPEKFSSKTEKEFGVVGASGCVDDANDGAQEAWMRAGSESADVGMAGLRRAMQASRRNEGQDALDNGVVDDGVGDGAAELKAKDELGGVGIDELIRRMNALHAAELQQQQQHVHSGASVLSYLNVMRRHVR